VLRRHRQDFRMSEMAQFERKLLPCRDASRQVSGHYGPLCGMHGDGWDGAGGTAAESSGNNPIDAAIHTNDVIECQIAAPMAATNGAPFSVGRPTVFG
jgi:hypothetical protein